jgi:predicted DNA-binding protein with PD1-like motif
MEAHAYQNRRSFLIRFGTGEDLLESLEEFCRREGVSCGTVTIIGSVSTAVLGYYHQVGRRYENFCLAEPLEIVSGLGNVSARLGAPFAHVHLSLSDARGQTRGGHLMPGTVVYAAEAWVCELDGEAPERVPDEGTGLNLWRWPPDGHRKGRG